MARHRKCKKTQTGCEEYEILISTYLLWSNILKAQVNDIETVRRLKQGVTNRKFQQEQMSHKEKGQVEGAF